MSTSSLGSINLQKYLSGCGGAVRGTMLNDCKNRFYSEDYEFRTLKKSLIAISKKNGTGDTVVFPATIPISPEIVAFMGLYSGDGAKGSEDPKKPGALKTSIAFSQREPNLVKFAVGSFRYLFGSSVRFTYSLGEDSAYFMADEGLEKLKKHYNGKLPRIPKLSSIRTNLNAADVRYLQERRPVPGSNEEHLAFYYFHKAAMEKILAAEKLKEIQRAGISIGREDKIRASLRRPFKKGARSPGGSSRSDELYLGGLNGFGELFLRILQSAEETLLENIEKSRDDLIHWEKKPEEGTTLDLYDFFTNSKYSKIEGSSPKVEQSGPYQLKAKWGTGKELLINSKIDISPLWLYGAGLYLAEGSTPKSKFFSMYKRKETGFAVGFTSSEGASLELYLKCLQKIFRKEDCVSNWKIKVGSQYFPELVNIGLKWGMPMLRGGNSGDGKLRTAEISIDLKDWGLNVADYLKNYEELFTHVEPTGAGVPRVDVSASSALSKWFFTLMMYSVFHRISPNPKDDFCD